MTIEALLTIASFHISSLIKFRGEGDSQPPETSSDPFMVLKACMAINLTYAITMHAITDDESCAAVRRLVIDEPYGPEGHDRTNHLRKHNERSTMSGAQIQ